MKIMQKDLILNRRIILLNGLIFLACLSFFASNSLNAPPRVFAGFASLMMAMVPATLITQEDKFKAMILGCSLPVDRKTIVQARFALSLGMALVGILAAFLFGALVPFSRFGFADLFAAIPLMTALTGVSVFLSLLLPFTLRFGLRGLLIFLVAMQVLGVVLLTLVQVTRSSLDKEIVDAIAGGLSRLYGALGPTGFNLAGLVFLALLLTVSYQVSVRIFHRRDL